MVFCHLQLDELLTANKNNEETQHDFTTSEQITTEPEQNSQVNLTNNFTQGTSNENTAIANICCCSPVIPLQGKKQPFTFKIDTNADNEINGLSCSICPRFIDHANNKGYVKTDSCNWDIDYHYHCLLQMKEKCIRQNKNMKCKQC
jgi:hypothetical protein